MTKRWPFGCLWSRVTHKFCTSTRCLLTGSHGTPQFSRLEACAVVSGAIIALNSAKSWRVQVGIIVDSLVCNRGKRQSSSRFFCCGCPDEFEWHVCDAACCNISLIRLKFAALLNATFHVQFVSLVSGPFLSCLELACCCKYFQNAL